MNRRAVCQTTATAVLTGVVGCLGGDSNESPTGNNTTGTDPDDTPTNVTEMIDTNRIDDAMFARTGNCSESGTATIEFNDREATITGCVTGHNGCAEPVVRSADVEGDRLQIVIGEEDRSDPDTFCTQALVHRGYELTLRFADDRAATVEVVHDDVDGRDVVATADRP